MIYIIPAMSLIGSRSCLTTLLERQAQRGVESRDVPLRPMPLPQRRSHCIVPCQAKWTQAGKGEAASFCWSELILKPDNH